MATQVKDQTPRVQYVATAGQTVFVYNFLIFVKTDITVEQNGTALAVDTDYTVSGVQNVDGGSITLLSGATAGDIITVYRSQGFDRETDYQDNSDFLAETVNKDYNRMILMDQQNREELSRSLQYAINDIVGGAEIPLKADRINKLLSFDGEGNISVTTPGDGAQDNALNITYDPPGAGAVSTTVQAKLRERITAADVGLVGDATDETARFNTALSNLSSGQTLELDGTKTYLVDNLDTITGKNNFKIKGNGATLKANPATAAGNCITLNTCTNVEIFGIIFDRQNSFRSGVQLSGIRSEDSSDVEVHHCDFSECYYGLLNVFVSGTSGKHLFHNNKANGRLDYSASNHTNSLLCHFTYRSLPGVDGGDRVYNNDVFQVDHLCQFNGPDSQAYLNKCRETHDTSIYLQHSNCTASWNEIYDAGKEGIKAIDSSGTGTPVSDCDISHNYINRAALTQTDGSSLIIVWGDSNIVNSNRLILSAQADIAGTEMNGILYNGIDNSIDDNTIRGSSPSLLYGRGIVSRGTTITTPNFDVINNKTTNNKIKDVAGGIFLSASFSAIVTDGNGIKHNELANCTDGIVSFNVDSNNALLTNTAIEDNSFDSCVNNFTLSYMDGLRLLRNKYSNTSGNRMGLQEITGLVGIDNEAFETGIMLSPADGQTLTVTTWRGNITENFENELDRWADPLASAMNTEGTTRVGQTAGGTGTIALPAGTRVGQEKYIYGSGFTSGSVDVTPSALVGGTKATFSNNAEVWQLGWNGFSWYTIFATATIT